MISLIGPRRPRGFYDFLSDPIDFLLRRGVKQVILMGGQEGKYRELPPADESSDDEELDVGDLQDDNDLRRTVEENDPQLEHRLGKDLLVKKHDGYVRALGKWFFRFFNYQVPISKFESFRDCVKKRLGADYDKLVQIIKSPTRSRLKDCYKKVQVSSDFNDTSLLAYHAPTTASSKRRVVQFDCLLPHCHLRELITPSSCLYSFSVDNCSRLGQLLTGDINFNTNLREIERHYRQYLQQTSIMQVPHHGAHKNWNAQILSHFNDDTTFVVSAGTYNNFNHPHPAVINDIKKKHKVLWCNESAGVNIGYVQQQRILPFTFS